MCNFDADDDQSRVLLREIALLMQMPLTHGCMLYCYSRQMVLEAEEEPCIGGGSDKQAALQ